MEDLPIFEISWIIPGLLVLAVVLFGFALYSWMRQRKIAAEAKRMESHRLHPEDELKTLGIVSVRQLEERAEPRTFAPRSGTSGDDMVQLPFHAGGSESSQQTNAIVDDLVTEDGFEEGDGAGVPRFSPKRTGAPVDTAESVSLGRHPGTYLDQGSTLWAESNPDCEPDAVAFLLESLWAAMNAQSVALLRFDEQRSSYAVDALVSERVTRQVDLFPAGGNVLNLVPADTSISVLEPDAFEALRYHANPVISVGHAVAIAVHGPKERVLLVADVEPGASAFGKQSLDRFGNYADLLAGLLPKDGTPAKKRNKASGERDTEIAPSSLKEAISGTINISDDTHASSAAGNSEDSRKSKQQRGDHDIVFDVAAAVEEGPPSIKVPSFDPTGENNGSSRPRNDIIAEEMAAARATQEPLALALVVPHDAVELAARGSRVVSKAEKQLIERLRGVAGSFRVERFGELVAGVFCKAGPAFVEAWVERVESSGPDVQIGVALLRARHRTPEAFRADAETALREAYERKEDCVIVD